MKNFLVDLYGTLIDIHTDEESPAFWAKIAGMLKGEASGETLKTAYCGLCREAKEGLSELQEFDLLSVFTRLLKQFQPRKQITAEEFAYAFRRASVFRCRPFSGAKEILSSLKARGARVYLLSNAQACFTRAELDEAGLSELFDGILISSEVGWKKPAPQFFETAFARFGLDKNDCLYVGNDLHDDVGGAHGAGLKCAYIQTPQSGKYPNPPVPDFVATDHENLREILLSLI